jgi:protoporphyrinogen oxidase
VRIYQASIDEVIKGCSTDKTPQVLYVTDFRYPKAGGYKHFLKSMVDKSDIRVHCKVASVDTMNKILTSENGAQFKYQRLISSMPLPELVNALTEAPEVVKQNASLLEATCGYHVSVALKGNRIPPYIMWYVYDEDILTARVHSPSIKSPNNVPEGCSSF